MNFKPLLFPNDKIDLSTVKYPMFASTKMDGIRCIFMNGKMFSRSLKEIPNAQLQKKFQHLKDYTKKKGVILDGELYGLKMSFQQITHFVMTEDLEDELLPEKVKFFCFDILSIDNLDMSFKERYAWLESLKFDNVVITKQKKVNSKAEVEEMFDEALEGGFEGLILKGINSKYKFGRITAKSGDGYKIKPFLTFDAKVIAVEERFENTSESFTNELGRSQKHSFKDEVKHTGIAACFVVMYEGLEQRVMITGEEAFRREIWEHKTNYVGKMIEFKGMLVGSKEKVRHPVFLRFRCDKENSK